MAIAVVRSYSQKVNSSSTNTISVNATGGDLILVQVNTFDGTTTDGQVSSITFNSTGFTQAVEQEGIAGTENWAEIWYLASPAQTTANLVVTNVGTTDAFGVFVSVLSGTNTASPIDASVGGTDNATSTASIDITTNYANSLLFSNSQSENNAYTSEGASQTNIAKLDSDYMWASYKSGGVAGAKTMSFVGSGSDRHCWTAVAIREATAASSPTVTTSAASSITYTTADGNGNVTSDGGATITERGFVWSTSSNPTTSDSKLIVSGTTGSYTGTMTPLTAGTGYHYRAYAINSVGTSYGSDTTFTTTSATSPTVTTDSTSSVSDVSATGSGTVSSENGASVTERGIVLNTSSNPTTSNTKYTTSGTTGAFFVSLTSLTPSTTYYIRAYAINSVGTSYGSNLSFSTTDTPVTPTIVATEKVQKKAFYKIYSKNLAYITTWSSDVISDPEFRTVINSGAGELKIQLARPYDNFGEGLDVALQNRVECWIGDADNTANNANSDTLWDVGMWDIDYWDGALTSFIKIYTGYISGYAPSLEDENQTIDVTVLGFTSEAAKRIVRDSSGNTEIAFNSYDPSNIMKGVIDLYRADGGTNINYIGTSINLTGTTVSYTFKGNTLKECLDKIVELCPEGWYWYMDANGIVFLSQQTAVANHQVTIGRDINLLQTNKRIENLVNVVYLIGGGDPPLFNRYVRQSSVDTYGKFEAKISDGRVTDTDTANIMAKSVLDRYDTPETRSVIRIVDNNGDDSNQGLNIENFNVGDTIQVKNLNFGTTSYSSWDISEWDVDVWDSTLNYSSADVMVIVSIDYTLDTIEIEASSRLPEVTKRIEDIKRNMDVFNQQNLPTAPVSTNI